MNLDLFSLQKSTIEDYNRLIAFLNKGRVDTDYDTITVDARQLERLLRQLHNDLAFVGSMIEKESDIPYLDGSKVRMQSFDFDELIDDGM